MKTKRAGLLGLLATSLLGIALLWWLVSQYHIDGAVFAGTLLHAPSPALGLGVLCFTISMALGALRYYVLFSGSVPFSYLFSVTLIQNALLNFLPWRSGEFGYPLLLRRDHGVPLAASTAYIVTVRLLDLLMIMGAAIIGSSRLGLDNNWLLALFALLLATVGVLTVMLKRFHARNRQLATIWSALLPLAQARRLAALLVISLALLVFTTVQSALIIQAMALNISLVDAMLLNVLTLMVALLPIHPPGGWGTVDAVQLVILQRLGYALETATPSILAAHSFYTVLILLGGMVGWLARGRRRVTAGLSHENVR